MWIYKNGLSLLPFATSKEQWETFHELSAQHEKSLIIDLFLKLDSNDKDRIKEKRNVISKACKITGCGMEQLSRRLC